MYYIVAFLIGGITIFQMMMNSTLSYTVGKINGIFYNYFIAVVFMVIFFIFNKTKFEEGIYSMNGSSLWLYVGGLIGIIVLLLCNYAIPKIPAIYTTGLIMVGQLVTGNIIEYIMTGNISMKKILGCTLILAGVMYDIVMEKIKKSKTLI